MVAKAYLPCDRGLHFAGTTVPLGCAGKIATEVAAGKHAALVVDQAGRHLSACLVVPDNITLLVPRHRGFAGWGRRRTGKSSGARSTSMLRATRGWRRTRPRRSSVRTIWCTEGGLSRKWHACRPMPADATIWVPLLSYWPPLNQAAAGHELLKIPDLRCPVDHSNAWRPRLTAAMLLSGVVQRNGSRIETSKDRIAASSD